MSIVPWLGHMFLTKRTPSRSSPAATPFACSTSGGSTETSRDWPSASASRAAFITAARAQPPPIQPSDTEPSGRMIAFAPALAAVTETVRTTVASAKGSPFAFMCRNAVEDVGRAVHGSDPREIGLERRKAFEIVRRREEVDRGKRRLHARAPTARSRASRSAD